ncbi:hypothetical protein MMC07_002744 [Pseudocyphellaria aurata]|nr:hypothetical protein [Pseudocyphellaria aurata]
MSPLVAHREYMDRKWEPWTELVAPRTDRNRPTRRHPGPGAHSKSSLRPCHAGRGVTAETSMPSGTGAPLDQGLTAVKPSEAMDESSGDDYSCSMIYTIAEALQEAERVWCGAE